MNNEENEIEMIEHNVRHWRIISIGFSHINPLGLEKNVSNMKM